MKQNGFPCSTPVSSCEPALTPPSLPQGLFGTMDFPPRSTTLQLSTDIDNLLLSNPSDSGFVPSGFSFPKPFSHPTPSCSNMVGVIEGFAALRVSIADIKDHLRRIFESICTSFKQNSKIAFDIGYNSQQITCQDSRIDDLERNLFEIMGKVDIIKEDVSSMVRMTQCSHCQESPTVNKEMADAASVQQQNYG